VACWSWPPDAVATSSDPRGSGRPTATWYEILGVASGASHDDIKRAYTTAALEWHPDRRPGARPEERESAERRIRELNAAWAVLGDPAARAAYDADLTAAARPQPVRRPAPGGSGARPPSFADRMVDPRTGAATAGGGSGRGWRWVGVALVGAVFVGVLVLTAYAAHHHTTGGGGVPSTVGGQSDQYPVGSCVAVTPGPVAFTVSCDQPHTGKVAATTDYPRPCPSGTSTVALVEQQISLCLTP